MIDLRDLCGGMQEEEVQRVIGEVVRQRFDLEGGPLLRARLVRMGDFEHRLFLIAHLSIVDGVSAYQIFPFELAMLYSAYSSGQRSPLRGLAVQFGDYTYWQRQWLQTEELGKQLDYWRRQLADVPALTWPIDRARASKQTFRGAIRAFVLPEGIGDAVKTLSQQEGVTLFMILLAAFAALLHCYTEQNDIVIGTPSPAGRKHSELEKLLGHFLNPVALRFDLADDPTFRDLFRQAKKLTLEAISHDDVPIELLARELKPTPDPSRNPFFTVAMSLQPSMPALSLQWSVTSMDVDSGGAPWDLYLAFIDRPSGIAGRVQYNPDLFDNGMIIQTLQHLQQLLKTISENPLKRLSQARLSATSLDSGLTCK